MSRATRVALDERAAAVVQGLLVALDAQPDPRDLLSRVDREVVLRRRSALQSALPGVGIHLPVYSKLASRVAGIERRIRHVHAIIGELKAQHAALPPGRDADAIAEIIECLEVRGFGALDCPSTVLIALQRLGAYGSDPWHADHYGSVTSLQQQLEEAREALAEHEQLLAAAVEDAEGVLAAA